MNAKLCAAMAKAFAEIEGASKDKVNPAFKSKYADLGSVIDAIKPHLIANDLYYMQHSQPAPDGVTVETWLYHAGGESLCLGSLYLPANKRDAQGFGSALTYARRYALMTAFGVPAEDDDGNAAVRASNGAARNGNGNGHAPIADDQRDLIQTLADAVGKPTRDICEAFKVASLKELTAKQAESTIARLKTMQPKETVQ